MELSFNLLPSRPAIAVVPLYEVIRGGRRSAAYIELFKRLRQDRRVHAVVLDIDSPGGSATTSDYLYMAARRLADEKPLVAFVRGTGASGAYLLACAAERIVAIPSAVVGSIGVLSVRPVLPELLERLGVRFAVQKTGPYKDSGAFYRVPTAEEEARNRAFIGEFHEHFLEIVARERRMDKEAVRALATGEVYWATRGKTIGLVDELGDLETAVEIAASLAGVPARSFVARPVRGLPGRLLGAATSALIEEVSMHVESALARCTL